MNRGDSQKLDGGKQMWDLLPLNLVVWVVRVLTFGALKYGANTWQKVDDPVNRYYVAMMRHIEAWQSGEKIDPDSGLPHLAHVMCNAMFLMWFEMYPNKIKNNNDNDIV